MATYTVTTSNWNDPAYWSGLSLANGDTLDLSALGSGFTFVFHNNDDRMVISDGVTSHAIGGATNPNENVSVGSGGLDSFDTIIGPDGAMDVTHGSQANSITTGSGADTVQAGAGNDTIIGGAGNDSIGAGADDDSVDAGTGNDWVNGGDGNDTIDGGDNDDTIYGGDGNDVIEAGEEANHGDDDLIYGGAGNDTITSVETDSRSNDTIYGEGGDDLIVVTGGDLNQLQGGDGADTIISGAGNDTLDGGAGNDTINGGSGDDSLSGGDGNDVLHGDNSTENLLTNGDFETGDMTGWTVNNPTGGFAPRNNGGEAQFNRGGEAVYGDSIEQTFSAPVGVQQTVSMDLSEFGGGASTQTFQIDILDNLGNVVATQTYTILNASTQTVSFDFVPTTDTSTIRITSTDANNGGASDGMVDNVSIVATDTGTGDDSIDGGAGNDEIFGGGGNDSIDGGAGDDILDGGEDADIFTLQNGFGNDTIIGGEGGVDYDTIDLSTVTTGVTVDWTGAEAGTIISGADTITFSEVEHIILTDNADKVNASSETVDISVDGGDGNDTILGGQGNDSLAGGAGNDMLQARDGNDTLDGGDGNDTLMGGTGDDVFHGGAGDDLIHLQVGNNTVDGGDDQDIISVSESPGLLGSNNVVDGGSGGVDIDWLSSSYLTSAVNVTFTGNEAGTLTTANGGGVTFSDIERIVGSAFDDTLDASLTTQGAYVSASAGNDTVIGGTGDDTLGGGDGDDYIDGGDGNDFLTTGEGQDTLLGGAGNDTLMNSDGDDSLDGGAGDDSIVATGGEDTLIGGTGADTMDGGDDADTFIIEDGFGNDSITGGEGTTDPGDQDSDTIDAGGVTSDLTVIFTGDEAGTITDGTDTITFSQIENVFTGSGADSLDASADSTGLGLFGNAGDDTITGGTGDDHMEGGDGADVIRINDSFGNDTIIGGEGGTDDDLIDLSALTGPVTVTYTGDEAGTITDGTDTITFSEIERLVLTDQADFVDASADSVGINVDAAGGNDSVVGGSGDDSVVGGTGVDTLEGGAGNDTIDGGFDSDSISGGDGADVILGDLGNDTIDGGAGDDSIDAGSDHDSVTGGTGNDTIDGGAGNNTLYGGDGNDVIYVGTGGGANGFAHGEAGDDTLYTGTGWGNDSLDGGDGNDLLIDQGDADSDDTLTGGAGDDTLQGGLGDDQLSGGTGDDTFTYTVGSGNDTITDFNAGNSGALGDGDTTNNDFIDLSGYYDNLTELREDFNDDGVLNQSNTTVLGGTVDYSNNDEMVFGDGITFQGADQSSFTADNTGVVCFTSGTAIRTPRGDVLIDDLHVGDLVTTMDNGPQRIAWIGQRHVGHAELLQNDRLHPVLIKKDVLGANRDLLVSRQHGMLLGQDHLGRAAHLAKTMPGIRVAKGKRQVTYVHLMFEAHQIIFAEGIPSESFYPGPMALEMLSNASREEMLLIFPKLTAATLGKDIIAAYGNTARAFLENRKAVSAWLSEGSGTAKNEIKKWDVDLAMERFETERIFGAAAVNLTRNSTQQVA